MIVYVPVLHEGYLRLFEKYAHTVECLYVFGEEFIAEDKYIAREIRALKPEVIARVISALKLFPTVRVLDRHKLPMLKELRDKVIIMTDDEFSRKFAEKHLVGQRLIVETQFLRWDERAVSSGVQVNIDRVSTDPRDIELIELARNESEQASCWWRHVGAVVVDPATDRVVLAAHNRHMPSEHTPYAVGDPRDFVQAGTSPELAATIHAEPTIVAMAAREGISLKGMHMYITVFPCGPCASIIAEAGISKLYFASGCAYLDGDHVLRSRGVEIVHVT